jgi:hypothetical protein
MGGNYEKMAWANLNFVFDRLNPPSGFSLNDDDEVLLLF